MFNGSAYAQANNSVIAGNSPFSISMWVNTNSLSGEKAVLDCGYSTFNSGIAVLFYNNKLILVINKRTSGTESLSFSTSFNANVWKHIVMTWTGDATTNGFKVYIDNILVGQTTALAPMPTPSHNLTLGKPATQSSSSYYFTGSLDNIRIYNRVLTEDEITALYSETR